MLKKILLTKNTPYKKKKKKNVINIRFSHPHLLKFSFSLEFFFKKMYNNNNNRKRKEREDTDELV